MAKKEKKPKPIIYCGLKGPDFDCAFRELFNYKNAKCLLVKTTCKQQKKR